MKPKHIDKTCSKHGVSTFVLEGRGYYRCMTCRVEHVMKRRKNLKIALVEYKGGKCMRCGYNRYLEVLEFHHRDPEQKDLEISFGTRNLEALKEEADKCDLYCPTCHREVHIEIRMGVNFVEGR